MKNKRFQKKGRRLLAGCMAAVCFFLAAAVSFDGMTLVSHATTFRGTNIWSGGSETLFGKSRNYLYRWTDGYQMTFCISPGKHMGSTVVADSLRTTITDESIPYIKSREDYKKLALICTWYDHNGSIMADNATYGAAQAAVWAIMNSGWESADSIAAAVNRHVRGTAARWQALKAYVENDSSDIEGVPSWVKTSSYGAEQEPVKMQLADGVWTAELDISSAPQLAALDWQFAGDSAGWSKRVEDGKLIFTYSGSQQAGIQVTAELTESLKAAAKNTSAINLYIPEGPKDRIQAMISAGVNEVKAYVQLAMTDEVSNPVGTGSEIHLDIYEHEETFQAHYLTDLGKFCAETGQPLENAEFRVLEAFDGSQVEGNIRTVYMTPKPAVWQNFKVCAEAVTDENGHISHTDTKKYKYLKTYCDGHPEPDYLPVPDGEGSEDEAAAVEEENERLYQKWKALVDACEAREMTGNHFHGMNSGEGLEKMLADRQEAYERFIELQYDYTFQEIQARYGYIRHGLHNDDQPIPVVRIRSSEAGGGYEIINKEVIVDESIGYGSESLEDEEEWEEDDLDRQAGNLQEAAGRADKPLYALENIRKVSDREEEDLIIMSERAATEADAVKNLPKEKTEDGDESIWNDEATPSDAARRSYRYQMLNRAVRMRAEEDEEDEGSAVLPEPEEDTVEPIEPYGDTDTVSYTFSVKDHRTEGEIHINKRDMELLDGESDDYDSYGDTQGDATLEGAVYGLYAAEDIVHPDGKTGTVYEKGSLTAIGTTDKNGDASFLAYTEESPALSLVGHPLIPGRYCIKEIARSEGYELTAGPDLSGAGEDSEGMEAVGRADVTATMSHPIDMHDGSWLEFDVTYQNTADGFDILVSGFPEGSTFFRSRMKETAETAEGGVVVGTRLVETGEYERASAGEYRLDENGNYIPLTDGDGNPLYDTSKPVSGTYYVTRRLNYYPSGEASPVVDPGKWADTSAADTDYVKAETNSMLEQIGYRLLDPEDGDDAPWTVLELSGNTNQELAEEILDWFAVNSFWDSGAVHSIRKTDKGYEAVIFHDMTRISGTAVYEQRSGMLYVRTGLDVTGMGRRHMFVPYEPSEFVMGNTYATVETVRKPQGEIVFPQNLGEVLEAVYQPLYQQYEEGEYRLDGQGNKIPIMKLEYIYEEKEEITSDYELTPLEAVYDPVSQAYRIHVDNTVDWNQTTEAVTETFRAVAPRQTIEENGEEMFFSDYLTNIKGAGASAFASLRLADGEKEPDWEENQKAGAIQLTYPGQISPMQDGEGTPGWGTRRKPFPTEENVIRQTVKVIKDVTGGEEEKLNNFRFKAYLKSNLKRLYRSDDGKIVWIDRKGREIDVLSSNQTYPGLVSDIFTQVPRRISPLYKDTSQAIEANPSLYDSEQEKRLSGYTAILETAEGGDSGEADPAAVRYNYEKFFQAIRVANHDKWDDGAPTYTSYRPLGNEANRSAEAEENAKASDMVRQFAIDWYLDKEAEKLTDSGKETAYSDELYDKALYQAILKADDYLEPFFEYDLDEIYAIEWEQDAEGGSDGDRTTLSADSDGGEYFYGISEYLPYGTYVIVEQQPAYEALRDFSNRHYAADRPREIVVPSVYEDGEDSGDILSSRYIYHKEMTPEELTKQYQIRFNEESDVIQAHNNSGDFQIYKYGMDIHRISNGTEDTAQWNYFALTQGRWKPYENYYNDQDDRTAGKVTYYLSEDGSGRDAIGQIYRYSSVSEDKGETGGIASMTGMTTAFDGMYSPALVSRNFEKDKSDEGLNDGADSARVRFLDEYYKVSLRIEKMDSETGENLLHDGAAFNIYRASREETPEGTGQVKFYEEDTTISGSREFLESMCAEDIRPMARTRQSGKISVLNWIEGILESAVRRTALGPGNLYTGLVRAGTPICQEEDRIYQTDAYGVKTGSFGSFITTRDGLMMDEATDSAMVNGEQNAGYLETPKPLEAGVYVLAESKVPDGYVRCRPIAIEIYSDEVTYYRKGDRDSRVVGAAYDRPQSGQDTARVYVENEPVKLQVEKLKEAFEPGGEAGRQTITYKVSGRIDGSLTQIGGNPGYEYAYKNGRYMGYAWKKGTLEYLKARKEAGEQVKIVYQEGLFAGYGYITRMLESADDKNPYVPGAVMTLFEGIAVLPSGDTQDQAFEGVTVQRQANGSVGRMYVEKGYAGTRTEFIQTQAEESRESEDTAYWSAETVQREDTDILYYDLGGLQIFQTETIDGRTVTYGFGRNHEKIPISQIEEDKQLVSRTDGGHSIFAFRGTVPVLELEGGDFTEISYSDEDKVLEGTFARPVRKNNGQVVMSSGVTVYHLDRDGNRDSLVDPYTGMAYAIAEDQTEETASAGIQVLVWPVTIARDENGQIIAKDKITTSRIATVNEDNENQEYLTGSWKSEAGEESHRLSTLEKNQRNQNMEGEQLLTENNGTFEKSMKLEYDEHGLPEYYRRGSGTYEQNTSLYDRSGSLIREKQADLLEDYEQASYHIDNQEPAYHRLGEGYILENTWVTGDSSPNDPFAEAMTEGQADILKRVPAGTYIMEELKAPEGYLKGLPVGVVVKETARIQKTDMVDYATKIVVNKVDGSENLEYSVLDMQKKTLTGTHPTIGSVTEGKGAFSFTQLPGASMALYPADDLSGEEREPEIQWTSGDTPLYREAVPTGKYTLEESSRPEGFVTAPPVQLEVEETRQVQDYTLYNDHTKMEIEKYMTDEEKGTVSLVDGAVFALYEAVTDEDGQVLYDEEGSPRYDKSRMADRFVSGSREEYAGFIEAFEDMYRTYGTEGRSLSWNYNGIDRSARYISHTQIDASDGGGSGSSFPTAAQMIFRTGTGADIRITIYQQQDNRQGKDFVFEYQFDYRKLPHVNERAVSYMTIEGRRRFDYLPADGVYVLVETQPPEGFAGAKPLIIRMEDTADVQRYRVENTEGAIMISKTFSDGSGKEEKELPGARMALYRAGASGELIRDDAHLAAWWISGRDGIYTELDQANGRIPQGYQPGDLKPHTLRRLPEGEYWLTEESSPDYYTTFEPVPISYHQEDQIRIVRVSDVPVKGSVEVLKTDEEGQTLAGAVFRLTAYMPPDFKNPVFVKTFSDSDGTARLDELPVGEIQEDGSILPYSYRLQEIVPPEGYALDPEILSFRFEPNRQGVSYQWGESAVYRQQIADEKTRIRIGKQDPAMEGMFIEGARLAVYQIQGMDENGNYRYDSETPAAIWTAGKEEQEHVLEGLTAGQTYLLAELQAPAGYLLMEPIAFTLSEDGRRIASLSTSLTAVAVHHLSWVTLTGRYGIKAVMEVADENGETVASWISSGQGHVLTAAGGIQDGQVYVFTERTVYSDGSREITNRETRRIHLEDGMYRTADRVPERVRLCLEGGDGTLIGAWDPEEGSSEFTLGGPESEEELLKINSSYILRETTFYNDGTEQTVNRFGFAIDENGLLKAVTAYDRERTVLIDKTDITGEKEVPGARLEILDEEGTVLEEWISGDEPHQAETELLPGHTYTLRETLPPKGYAYSGDIVFSVENDGSIQQVIMEDKETAVSVTKTDITGEKEIPGAKLQILDKDGNCVEEWTSAGEPHKVEGKLTAGETYTLHEESAPAGYAYAADMEFTVSKDGSIDKVVMKDERIPDRSHYESDTPESPRKIGNVLAEYQPYLFPSDGVPQGAWRRVAVPATGDDTGLALPFAVLFLSFGVLVILWLTRKKTGLFLLLLFLLILPAADARAETVDFSAPGEITVTYDFSEEDSDGDASPPERYVWENEEYRLEAYQIMTAESNEASEIMTETVRYEEVEQAMEIPQEYPVADMTYENWRWIPGFEFTVTVKGYDGGSFYLGDRIVAVKEEQPFEGREQELLELIGVDPEYYLIEDSRWISEPQIGEDGLTYRQAVASGQKYVADVSVVYTKESETETVPSMICQAVYRIPEATPSDGERTISETLAEEELPERPPETEESLPEDSGGFLNWFRNLSRRTQVILGIGLLLLPVLCFRFWTVLAGRRKREENHRYKNKE